MGVRIGQTPAAITRLDSTSVRRNARTGEGQLFPKDPNAKQPDPIRAGFGKGSLSSQGAAFETVSKNLKYVRDTQPTVEELQESAAEKAAEARQQAAEQTEGAATSGNADSVAAAPGQPNMFGLVQAEANAIKPGKRMLSAMAPTIVLDPKGQLLMVTGAAGGPTIITAVMDIILNVVEHGMTLADAMKAPRLHHQWLPDRIAVERNAFSPDTLALLRSMGHTLFEGPEQGVAEVIVLNAKEGLLEGGRRQIQFNCHRRPPGNGRSTRTVPRAGS